MIFGLRGGYCDCVLNEEFVVNGNTLKPDSLKLIQKHFGNLSALAMKYFRFNLFYKLRKISMECSCELTIYGKNGYTTKNLAAFAAGLKNDLPSAEGFRISTTYCGPFTELIFNSPVSKNKHFFDDMFDISKADDFTYSFFADVGYPGTECVVNIHNGEWQSLENLCTYSPDVLDNDFGMDWDSTNMDIDVKFDFEKYPEILEALHECVRRHIPEDQLEYCESGWEDGDVGILCSSIFWSTRKLRVVQDFLDELNEILLPIKDECHGNCGMGKWFIKETPFAVSTLDWTEDGFRVLSARL